jgi:formylglycine-generating enzyme required for sulfatase activity
MRDQLLYEMLGMIPVSAGTFLMGSSENLQNRRSMLGFGENEIHEVCLTRAFELGRFPVTNLIWSLVTETQIEGDPLHPRTKVSWYDAVKFCQKLNAQLGLPQAITRSSRDNFDINLNSCGFRLPTEAEWEYCCRAGTPEDRYGPLDDIAWHKGNCSKIIQPVGLKLPNSWGFHDMLGNASEWCWDFFEHSISQKLDPLGPETGFSRVVRGCRIDPGILFAFNRSFFQPQSGFASIGFRLARTLPSE